MNNFEFNSLAIIYINMIKLILPVLPLRDIVVFPHMVAHYLLEESSQ